MLLLLLLYVTIYVVVCYYCYCCLLLLLLLYVTIAVVADFYCCGLILLMLMFYATVVVSWLFMSLYNRIGGVMVCVLASKAVDRGFEPLSDQHKDYKICTFWFFTKHASLRRKSKDWLAWNQDNVSEWSNMSICGLLFQWASTIKIQLRVLV